MEEKDIYDYVPKAFPISYMPGNKESHRSCNREILKDVGSQFNLDLISVFNKIIDDDEKEGFIDNTREMYFMTFVLRKMDDKMLDVAALLSEVDKQTEEVERIKMNFSKKV